MGIKIYLENALADIPRVIFEKYNRMTKRRPSSAPFLSGDTYRSCADFLYDETRLCTAEQINAFSKSNINKARKHPVVFLKSALYEKFAAEILPELTIPVVLLTHQSDTNITDDAKFKEIADHKMVIHWFAQNCTLRNDKVTPLPIGLEDLWRHNAGALADFRNSHYVNRPKKNEILYGFTLRTNPEKRVACYLALCKAPHTQEITGSPCCHVYRKMLSTFKMVASPEGNGLDCHRTWEAMYLGVVPLVESNEMHEYFASLGLPFIIIDDWKTAAGWTEAEIEEKYNNAIENANRDPLYIGYWLEQIECRTGAVDAMQPVKV